MEQKIISNDYQKSILKLMGINRTKRNSLSKETGISESTLRKLLDSDTPVVVSGRTFLLIDEWVKKVSI